MDASSAQGYMLRGAGNLLLRSRKEAGQQQVNGALAQSRREIGLQLYWGALRDAGDAAGPHAALRS